MQWAQLPASPIIRGLRGAAVEQTLTFTFLKQAQNTSSRGMMGHQKLEGLSRTLLGLNPLSRRKAKRVPGLCESQPYPCAPSAALGGERQTAAACSAQRQAPPGEWREEKTGKREGGRERGRLRRRDQEAGHCFKLRTVSQLAGTNSNTDWNSLNIAVPQSESPNWLTRLSCHLYIATLASLLPCYPWRLQPQPIPQGSCGECPERTEEQRLHRKPWRCEGRGGRAKSVDLDTLLKGALALHHGSPPQALF